MKNKALKALIILLGVLLVCLFLARTVQTITTPKIKRIQPAYARLDDKTKVSGEVHFSKGTDIYLFDAAGLNVVIDEVKVKEGYKVKEGDLLATTRVGSYAEKKAEIESNIQKASREYATEFAANIRFIKDSEHNQIYQSVLELSDVYFAKKSEVLVAAQKAGYTLQGDVPDWGITPDEERIAKNKSQPLKTPLDQEAPEEVKVKIAEAFEAYLKKLEAEGKLRGIYNGSYGQREYDMVFDHIKKLYSIKEQIGLSEKALLKLEKTVDQLKEIKAPSDGYLLSFKLKTGDSIDGQKAIYTISQADTKPSLRFDISSIKRNIKVGTKISIDGVKSDVKIAEIELGEGEKKYAVVELTDALIQELGGVAKLMRGSITGTVMYKAEKATTLIPASAVRSESEDKYYVYTVENTWSGMFGNSQYIIRKVPITVIEKTNSVVSIMEDMSYVSIADKEDRAIKEGQTVMDYVE